MAAQLPTFLRLNDARQQKNVLWASLSPFEVEIVDTVARGGSVFGGKGSLRIVIQEPGRKGDNKVVDQGMTTVRLLVKRGWLRFAEMTDGSGWFWLTGNAERLWDVLGRWRRR